MTPYACNSCPVQATTVLAPRYRIKKGPPGRSPSRGVRCRCAFTSQRTMSADPTSILHQVLALCLPKMGCVTLAAIASSCKILQATVHSLARSNSTAAYLLCRSVRDAAIYHDESQYQQAVTWLCQLEGFDAAHHLQGTTAAALLGTPFVPETTAAALAAAGLRFSYQQVAEACARPVAGAWVLVKAGAVTDTPELAQHMLLNSWLVSATLSCSTHRCMRLECCIRPRLT
jgi:hypothetical protein